MTTFLYVQTRKFHPDYDTAEDHKTFELQWIAAGWRALDQPPRGILDIMTDVGLMHRAWNGPWCIPNPSDTTDGKIFLIDEPNLLYRCCVCGTAWHILDQR